MTSERRDHVELLQGTLDLIVLRALSTLGAQHAYGLAARLQQVADHPLSLNQGTLYVALTRLEQRGWIRGAWQRTETNREAKYYAITKSGLRSLDRPVARWRRLVGFVDTLLLGEVEPCPDFGAFSRGCTPSVCLDEQSASSHERSTRTSAFSKRSICVVV